MPTDLTSQIFNLFATLWEYPTPQLLPKAEECVQLTAEINPLAVPHLEAFRDAIRVAPIHQTEELYTRLFDMQPLCYPYVGYQLFGENYKRGAFMAQLNETYRLCGFSAGQELPDHVAVILHYLALDAEKRSDDFGAALIDDGLLPALEKMIPALQKYPENPYAALALALQTLLLGQPEKELGHA